MSSPTSPATPPTQVPTIWPQEDLEHKLGAAAILEQRPVASLQELVALRSKGWEVDGLNDHFKHQRSSADRNVGNNNRYWYKTMKGVMGELDSAARVVPVFANIEFLDVGCAPGGFSGYVLQKNRRASGVGISLPVALGGYDLCLDQQVLSRFSYIERDVLSYYLHAAPETNPDEESSEAFPAEMHARFHLVILDGHALRPYTTAVLASSDCVDPPDADEDTSAERKFAHAAYRDALLVGQIIIALSAVRTGGTVVAKLSHAECFPAAQLIYLLDVLSDSLLLHKPSVVHSNRGTFYAIAKGVGRGLGAGMMPAYLASLRELWRELRFGGPDGRGRFLSAKDLDFVVTAEMILEDYVDRLVELGNGVWQTQVKGLQYFFRKKGISGV